MNEKLQEKDFIPKLFLTLPSPDQRGPNPLNSTPVSYLSKKHDGSKGESADFSFGLPKENDISGTDSEPLESLPTKDESSSPGLIQLKLSSIFQNGNR